jgi:hypothetical protein
MRIHTVVFWIAISLLGGYKRFGVLTSSSEYKCFSNRLCVVLAQFEIMDCLLL